MVVSDLRIQERWVRREDHKWDYTKHAYTPGRLPAFTLEATILDKCPMRGNKGDAGDYAIRDVTLKEYMALTYD